MLQHGKTYFSSENVISRPNDIKINSDFVSQFWYTIGIKVFW